MSKDQPSRKLTQPEKDRRLKRRLRQQFASSENSLSFSEVERRCPPDIDPKLLQYGIQEVRRRLRASSNVASGRKGIYGGNIARGAESYVGVLPDAHRRFFVDWVNWLVLHRVELTSGRYAPRLAEAAIDAMIAAGGARGQAAASPQPPAMPVRQPPPPAPETMSSAEDKKAEDEQVDALPDDVPHSVADEKEALVAVQAGTNAQQIQTDRAPSPEPFEVTTDVRGSAESAGDGGVAISGSVHDCEAIDSRQQGLPLAGARAPLTPPKMRFTFKKEGQAKANAFFGSIVFGESIDRIVAKGRILAADVKAVRAVQQRGPEESEYLAKAMADLGIDLP